MNEDLIGKKCKEVENIGLCERVKEKLYYTVCEEAVFTKNDTKVKMASIIKYNKK